MQISCNAFTDFVGFLAYAIIDDQTPVSGDIIELSGVVTNAGGAYNSGTSTFTCPTSAYYYFHFSLLIEAGDSPYNYCRVHMTMDNVKIVMVPVEYL